MESLIPHALYMQLYKEGKITVLPEQDLPTLYSALPKPIIKIYDENADTADNFILRDRNYILIDIPSES